MNPQDKIAIILFISSIVVVATTMELFKLTPEPKTKWYWRVLGGLLSAVCTVSVWFGVDHTGTIYLLPLALIAGYVFQYALDMFGVKKLFVLLANAYNKKMGYDIKDFE